MMDISFDVDVNLEEVQNGSQPAKDGINSVNQLFNYPLILINLFLIDCNSHDYDNQKLFSIYESYLAKGDISDTESEPDMSFNYELNDNPIENRLKTPLNSRVSRRISCFADIQNKEIENMKSTPRESTPNASQDSIDEINELEIPWKLSDMSEKEIIDLINKLEDDLMDKEVNYPNIAANNMKVKFDKQIQFFHQINQQIDNNLLLSSEHHNRLNHNTSYDVLLSQQLKDIHLKCEQFTKLMFELKLTRELLNK